jgi:hypothetical protein
MAVEVDGRWSTICCRRVVAMFMTGDGEGGESDAGPPKRCSILYSLFLSDTAKPGTKPGGLVR